MGDILWGTSSWSHASWEGVFYPPGTPPAEYLGHYAREFPTVEVDATYYRIPDHRMVEGWARRTPEGFVLSAKFPRSIVHGGERQAPNPSRLLQPEHVAADVERFLANMALLGSKCGPLVLQFPYFNKRAFATRAPFLARLDAFLGTLPRTFRYGVEIRNRDWLDGELLALLRGHGVALVLVDLVYMPHPAELAETLELVTTDFVYVRLIGDRKAVEDATDTFDRIVLDMTPRLERWAPLLRALRERVTRVLVYANNHYAGHGPATVRQLRDLTEGTPAPAP
jgi:uncharacterized protein YecE (DUF72 family)